MEKLATDIYTFENLRKDGYTYVDKTVQILPLVDKSIGRQFFLARPRRFGKSLLISTMHSLFDGRRELFKGLSIETKWDWTKTWPVLHLDMGSCQADTIDGTCEKIRARLVKESERLGVPLREGAVSVQFEFLINDIANRKGEQVVLLIDEYDKPLLNHLTKPDVTEFRDALKEFYSVIKTCENQQRFTFITGVSKFSKVSIFSDLNNLIDITMMPSAATLLGYTHDELKRFFPETLQKIAAANGLDAEGAFNKIVKWYGGYRFAPGAETIVNPVSFAGLSQQCCFKYYWINTTSLIEIILKLIEAHPLDFSEIVAGNSLIDGYDPECPEALSMLYQTGYLTLQNTGLSKSPCRFICPNLEVEGQLFGRVAEIYSGRKCGNGVDWCFKAQEAIFTGDIDRFVKALKCLFANIPYSLTDRQNEQMWQTIVYVILRAIGVGVNAEVLTNEGRIDMTCETPAAIWLVEFKLDKSVDEALAQIEANHYAEKFDLASKRVIKIGISFSSEQRTITDVKIA